MQAKVLWQSNCVSLPTNVYVSMARLIGVGGLYDRIYNPTQLEGIGEACSVQTDVGTYDCLLSNRLKL